jgi:A/G-specific adenine glycosylase
MAESLDPEILRRVRSQLVSWYAHAHRDLPWRKSRDPYAVWISEIMLQQTRVETVVDYFNRWMTRFPTVNELASADINDVLVVWQGLGYYSRARNLHAAANEIVDRHGGVFPSDVGSIAALKGIGRYTTGAIASIAFGQEVPLVDGNVARVFSRLLEIDLDPKSTAAARRYWAIAELLVKGEKPGELNQALMELGATVCTPRQTRCGRCPVADDCRALAKGRVAELPPKAKKTAQREELRVAIVARDGAGRVWVARRAERGLLGGLWEFPMVPAEGAAVAVDGAMSAVGAGSGRALPSFVHVFSHIRMTVIPVLVEGAIRFGAELDGYEQFAWVSPAELEALPVSRLMRKVREVVEAGGQTALL